MIVGTSEFVYSGRRASELDDRRKAGAKRALKPRQAWAIRFLPRPAQAASWPRTFWPRPLQPLRGRDGVRIKMGNLVAGW